MNEGILLYYCYDQAPDYDQIFSKRGICGKMQDGVKLQIPKAEILQLPVSVRSWILLRCYLGQSWDMDVFVKVIEDYYTEMPLFEVYELFERAEQMADEQSFQWLLERLFSLKSMSIQDKGCFSVIRNTTTMPLVLR